ncbi:MAG: hypothetical protein NTX03_14460 [Bacteroidetes bacterium]|nr:hypothetical protein [Bacteroidota bacterium]
MKQNIKRKYLLKDTELHTKASLFHSCLVTYLTEFSSRFLFINQQYIDDFEQLIESCRKYPHDSGNIADGRVYTGEVKQLIKLAKDKISEVKAYAKIIYPSEDINANIYNAKKFQEAAANVSKLYDLLLHVHNFVTSDARKPDFLAKGYTQTDMDALLTTAEELSAQNTISVAGKTDRQTDTQTRIELHNQVYDQLKVIRICAKVVFRTNRAVYNLFNLKKERNPVPTTIEVLVNAAQTNAKLKGATITIDGKKTYAPKTTARTGKVKFLIVKASPTVNIKVIHPDYPPYILTAQKLKLKKKNVVKVVMGG